MRLEISGLSPMLLLDLVKALCRTKLIVVFPVLRKQYLSPVLTPVPVTQHTGTQRPGIIVHSVNPTVRRKSQRQVISEREASLIYKMSSRTAKAT